MFIDISLKLFLYICLLCLSSLAFPAFSIDISEVIEDARLNDSEYLSKKADQKTKLAKQSSVRSLLYPSINANFNQIYTSESLSAPGLPFVTQGAADFRTQTYGISLKQVIFNKEIFSNLKAVQLETVISEIELLIIENGLIIRVIEAYIEVLNAKENLKLFLSTTKSSKQQYELVQQQVNIGLATNADLLQAKARWQLAIAEEISAKNALKQAESGIYRLSGRTYFIYDEISMKSASNDFFVNRDIVLEGNLEYLKQKIQVKRAKVNLAKEKAKRYPTLELIADRNSNRLDGSLSGAGSASDNTQVILQLEIPLFSGGRAKSLITSARYEVESEEAKLIGVEESVLLKNRSLIDRIIAEDLRIRALESALLANEESLKLRREMFKQGVEDNISVLNAQREVFDARKNLQESRYSKVSFLIEYLDNAGLINLIEQYLRF